ncbi:hypothetical protein [Mucilaginibacter sp.]
MNLLGLAAIAVAISASAFTAPVKAAHKASGLYWFSISGNRAPSQNVPEADATFIQQSDVAPAESCPTGSVHQCVSGFDASQVNTGTDQLNGTQSPASESQLKN